MTMNGRKAVAALAFSILTLAIAAVLPGAPREARAADAPATATEAPRIISVDADHPSAPLYRFWTVTNTVDPHTLPDPDGISKLRDCTPLMREINCDFEMGGMYPGKNDWFLGVNPDGTIGADFKGMIAQLKVIEDAGYSPRVVLEDVPDAMSDPATRHVYGNTAPPKDEKIWHAYVQQAVQAMVKAFGADKVKTWTFRVGTEPDLYPDHWSGTKEQYFAHYDYSADAVRAALPGARVGPGNILQTDGQPVPSRRAAGHVKWGLDIIDHCATGKNACTGGVGAPMDVFSTSWYENVGMPTVAFNNAITPIRRRLDKYPQFRHTPIEVGEFSVLRDAHHRHLYAGESTEWSASFYASLADRAYTLGVKQIYEWDDATLGVFHPQGRVLQMLDQMAGGARLPVTVKQAQTAAAGGAAAEPSDVECGAIACRQGSDLLLLVYNHRPERSPAIAQKVHLAVTDQRMQPGQVWRMTESIIDHDHAVWAYAFAADCKAAGVEPLRRAGLYEGSPTRLYGAPGLEVFKKNAAKYEKLSEVPVIKDQAPIAVAKGQWTLDAELPGHSVTWIRLSPPQK